jgi:hypothetical protein
MAENISFYKAIDPNNPDRMHTGDIFKCDNGDEIIKEGSKFEFKNSHKAVIITYSILMLPGIVIRAEPRVLSADELINKAVAETARCGGILSVRLVELCRKNFRLERDLELRRKLIEMQRSLCPMAFVETFDYILENLKLLNQDNENEME